jgi:bacterioferritin
MTNRESSIDLLNAAVADELFAVHQYMYFHFHLDDQGFAPLAMLFKRTAIVEMGHVEKLAERILFLKGDVKMAVNGAFAAITDPAEMLAKAAAMEEQSASDYNTVADEEAHFEAYDKQLEHLKRFGPNYLALQALGKESGETEAAG